MAAAATWGRIVFCGPRGEEVAATIAGRGRPDLSTIDALARAQLWARRRGGSIRLDDTCDELAALLDLVGLRREVGG